MEREQTKTMAERRRELIEAENEQIEGLQDMIWAISDHTLSAREIGKMRELIRMFGFWNVWDALEIALDQYFEQRHPGTMETVMRKLGGICYNRRKVQEELMMR